MGLKWDKKVDNRIIKLSFFDYLRGFFAEGFGWLILGLIASCGLIYLFWGI